MDTQHVVVIGGGFGGVYSTKYLLKSGCRVTLISERNYFTFTPLLHEVATGGLTAHDIIFEYSSFFNTPRLTFLRAHVESVDLENKKISLPDEELDFDYVVLATGAETNYYNMRGAEHAFELKTIDEAQAIKKEIVSLAQGTKHDMDIVIIGAGPTGIELALEVKQFTKALRKLNNHASCNLTVLNGFPHVLNAFDQKVQRYARKVLDKRGVTIKNETFAEEITKTSVKTSKGDVPSDVTILAAGVKPRVGVFPSKLLTEKQHVNVNEYLQVGDYEHVFALGDIIVQNDKPIPKLAQTATQQAKVVAENIKRSRQGQPLKPYKLKLKGMLVSLGKHEGAGTIAGITITGWFAWFLWRTVYLFKTPGLVNKLRVAFTWTLNLFANRSLTEE